MRRPAVILVLLALLVCTAPARAAVDHIDILERLPFADGAGFGAAGGGVA